MKPILIKPDMSINVLNSSRWSEGRFAYRELHTGFGVDFQPRYMYFIHNAIHKLVQFFTLNPMVCLLKNLRFLFLSLLFELIGSVGPEPANKLFKKPVNLTVRSDLRRQVNCFF